MSMKTFTVAIGIAAAAAVLWMAPVQALPLSPGSIVVDPGSSNIENVAMRRYYRMHGGSRHYGRAYRGGRAYSRSRYYRHYPRRYAYNHGYHNHYNHHHHNHYNNYYPFYGALALGFGGYYGGGYYGDGYYGGGYYGGGYGNSHVEWCQNRYRSYDPSTDTYLGYDGYRHRCRAPY